MARVDAAAVRSGSCGWLIPPELVARVEGNGELAADVALDWLVVEGFVDR